MKRKNKFDLQRTFRLTAKLLQRKWETGKQSDSGAGCGDQAEQFPT
jgi:hypothetical protein